MLLATPMGTPALAGDVPMVEGDVRALARWESGALRRTGPGWGLARRVGA